MYARDRTESKKINRPLTQYEKLVIKKPTDLYDQNIDWWSVGVLCYQLLTDDKDMNNYPYNYDKYIIEENARNFIALLTSTEKKCGM